MFQKDFDSHNYIEVNFIVRGKISKDFCMLGFHFKLSEKKKKIPPTKTSDYIKFISTPKPFTTHTFTLDSISNFNSLLFCFLVYLFIFFM